MADVKLLNDGVILNDEQEELKKAIVEWYKNFQNRTHPDDGKIDRRDYFVYSGPAGSGKTTVMRQALEALDLNIEEDVAACAYVGKAVMVMKMNGLDAKTIHSLIYYTDIKKYTDEKGKEKTKYVFKLKSKSALSQYKIIYCDEAAMVPENLFIDLMSFNIPIIFAGDKNQLPPVMSSSYIMDDPDFVLTKIMRQAEGNPIIWLSQRVLKNQWLHYGTYGNSRVLENFHMGMNLLTDYDVILTNTLRLRESLNHYIRRELLHIKEISTPKRYEKMICRSNNWSFSIDGFYLVNGMTGFLIDGYGSTNKDEYVNIDFLPEIFVNEDDNIYESIFDDDKVFYGVPIDVKYLKASIDEKRNFGIPKYTKMEYGYVINVHIAQGSQYRRVLYFDDPFGGSREMAKKLRYTAITRAIDKIDIVRVNRGDDIYSL